MSHAITFITGASVGAVIGIVTLSLLIGGGR